jgi:hypothetical protein
LYRQGTFGGTFLRKQIHLWALALDFLLLEHKRALTSVIGHVDHDILNPPFLKHFDRVVNVALEITVIAAERANKQLKWPEMNGLLYAEPGSSRRHAPHQSRFRARCGTRRH